MRQRSHYLKEETDMAMNPYEMRWDFLREAQSRLENKLENDIQKWHELKERIGHTEEVPPFPEYPTAEEIHTVAEQMRKFVENGAK